MPLRRPGQKTPRRNSRVPGARRQHAGPRRRTASAPVPPTRRARPSCAITRARTLVAHNLSRPIRRQPYQPARLAHLSLTIPRRALPVEPPECLRRPAPSRPPRSARSPSTCTAGRTARAAEPGQGRTRRAGRPGRQWCSDMGPGPCGGLDRRVDATGYFGEGALTWSLGRPAAGIACATSSNRLRCTSPSRCAGQYCARQGSERRCGGGTRSVRRSPCDPPRPGRAQASVARCAGSRDPDDGDADTWRSVRNPPFAVEAFDAGVAAPRVWSPEGRRLFPGRLAAQAAGADRRDVLGGLRGRPPFRTAGVDVRVDGVLRRG